LNHTNQERIRENKNLARIARRTESDKKTRKKIISQESQEKQDPDKNSRTQESCLARHFLSRQPRLYLHESCQKVKIYFFRQESYL